MKSVKNIYQLNEIKKGETGTGLLIEHDGHIIQSQNTINQIKEDIENPHIKLWCPEKFIVSAVFQKYGIKNANGRVYPESVLRREVDKYIREYVSTRSAIGALDHPSSSTLSGHDVSHVITELHWENQTLVGEMEIHTSPGFRQYGVCSTSGDLVANMLISDILIGVSSRGVGSVKQAPGGLLVVDDDFEIVCWDVVVQPSTNNAFIKLNSADLQPFIESDSSKKGTIINEKIKQINQLLN